MTERPTYEPLPDEIVHAAASADIAAYLAARGEQLIPAGTGRYKLAEHDSLAIPDNIWIVNIPPYPPEMNPMEQIWRELRTQGFRNEIFQTLEKVDDRLCDTIRELSPETIKSICGRDWIVECF